MSPALLISVPPLLVATSPTDWAPAPLLQVETWDEVVVPVFTSTWPLLLTAIAELGLDPGTLTTLNATCENPKLEVRAKTAISATLFTFFTVIHPHVRSADV
jgi:hypothetical protein